MSNPNQKIGKRLGVIASIFLLIIFYVLFENQIQNAYNPNQKVQTRYDKKNITILLQSNQQGHYIADGFINKQRVTFLVDTGATLVALPKSIAHQAGLPKSGRNQSFNTANGVVKGYLVNIPAIELGGIIVNNVKGAVMPDHALNEALLGMSFLKHLNLEQQNKNLILKVPND